MRSKYPTLSMLRFVAVALAGLALAWNAAADDRNLLRDDAADPYVFIVLDTSGSMNWKIGEYLPTMRADDPESKMFQAKDALYEVVDSLEDVHFGFASFNNDYMRIRRKHWAYVAETDGVTLFNDSSGNPLWVYPQAGDVHIFGRTQSCYDSRSYAGCDSNNPARLYDAWEKRRMELYQKFGSTASVGDTTTFYIRVDNGQGDDNYRFQVTFQLLSGSYGDDTMRVRVFVRNTNRSSFFGFSDVTFRLAEGSEYGFITWDLGAARKEVNGEEGYFGGNATESFSDNTCAGWEGNDDTDRDPYQNVTLMLDSPSNPGILEYGDVIPLNWDDKNREKVLDRLAPNRLLPGVDVNDPTFTPDFRVARYLDNDDYSSKLPMIQDLRVGQSSDPTADIISPLVIPRGSTPLGNSLEDFRHWYAGSTGNGGWLAQAEEEDAQFSCRNVYILMLTDGNETCRSDAPGEAATLLADYGVRTYVIGFGVEGGSGSDSLDDIAQAGGTTAPFRPQSTDELVRALQDIFDDIRPEVSTFASAAVPSVQTNVSDKVILSTFTPVKQASTWAGRLDAYLSPIPLDADGKPARDRLCGTTRTSSCRLWDGGEEVMAQSLEASDLDDALQVAGGDPVGLAVDQRRVFYSPVVGAPAAVPLPRAAFWLDDANDDSDWEDLIFGLGIAADAAPSSSFDDGKDRASLVLRDTYKIKHETISVRQPDNTTVIEPIDYVLGDIFHSDPVVVDRPNAFDLFSVDLESNGKPCDDTSEPNPGYRCYFEKHLYRRKMLMAAANDGQVHAFDAGILREKNTGGEVVREYDDGSGRELFSFVPRATMGEVRDLVEETEESGHRFSLDGRLVPADVFIDPVHDGTPNAAQREWRTIVLGSQREGGRSVFALDVTQPDELTDGVESGYNLDNIPQPLAGTDGTIEDVVPSCTAGGSGCGPLAFPSMLWEFTDLSDEDANSTPGDGFVDLGDTWSIPNVGLIKVEVDGDVTTRWVAIFGGGLDPEHINTTDRPGLVGNWIYMVDIETGKTLYKRAVDGAVPSAPAVVDRNSDLYLDTIYFGTTGGSMYKIDLSGAPPEVDDVTGRIEPGLTDVWEPFVLFQTGDRPIFFPPSVLNVADRGVVALAFGTGDREDLWRESPAQTGRFFIVVDDFYNAGSAGLPLTTTSLAKLDFDDPGFDFSENRLKNGNGWWVELRENERQIANVFSLSGITVFSTYKPKDADTGTTTTGDNFCRQQGESRIYVVFTATGGAIRPTGHYAAVQGFITGVFTKLGQTQNAPDPNGPGTPGGDDDDDDDSATQTGDVLTPELIAIRDSLKDLFPDLCRFGNFTINIYTQEQNTGQIFISPVPICTVQHNWREN